VLRVYVFAPPPPLSGTGSACHLPPPLSILDYSSLFVFQFCGVAWFWCCSLAQKISSVIHFLPCFRECLIPCLLSDFSALIVFIYWVFGTEFSSLPCSLSLRCLHSATCHSTVCAKLQFAVCFTVLLEGDWTALGLCWFEPMWCIMLTCFFCQLTNRQLWNQQWWQWRWWWQWETALTFLNAG
jgi:hypothetical protein